MKDACVITLHRRGAEKIVISPEFENSQHTLEFLHELLKDFNHFLKFYPSEDPYQYYNDDFFLDIEFAANCKDLPVENFQESGERLIQSCLEAALNFVIK
jgi:hypothetical protein